MKLPRNQLAFICLILVCIILAQIEANPEPARSRSSRSRSSNSGSSYGSNTNSRGSRGSLGGYGGKKKKGMSTLKKAAIVGGVGAVAYGSYQLGKATGRWGSYHHGGRWGYNDYDRWRQADGMLCRNDKDCLWIDPHMFCTAHQFDFSINRGWFGGDWVSVRGKCECPRSMHWDDWEIQCQKNIFGAFGGIAALVSIILVSCCCCGGCAALYFFKRR